jgi:aryl-alcohol dehydrogenase-like predicted oxidoreductase
MAEWLEQRVRLGGSGLMAGRLGLGASYGAPAAAYEKAFNAGCNYFYWGALRRSHMAEAIRNITARGRRDDLIVVIQAFRRTSRGVEKSLMRGLKRLGLDWEDVLLLGGQRKSPKPQLLEAVIRMREKGAFRCLGLASHNRPLFPELAKDSRFDLFHVRYNAANRGADVDVFPHLADKRPGIVAFTATRRMTLTKSDRIPADEKRPMASDCYRFVLSNPGVDVVITAPKNIRHMEENLVGVGKGPMNAEELGWMRRVGDYVYGKRRDY